MSDQLSMEGLAAKVIAVIAKSQRIPPGSLSIDSSFEEPKIDSLDGINRARERSRRPELTRRFSRPGDDTAMITGTSLGGQFTQEEGHLRLDREIIRGSHPSPFRAPCLTTAEG